MFVHGLDLQVVFTARQADEPTRAFENKGLRALPSGCGIVSGVNGGPGVGDDIAQLAVVDLDLDKSTAVRSRSRRLRLLGFEGNGSFDQIGEGLVGRRGLSQPLVQIIIGGRHVTHRALGVQQGFPHPVEPLSARLIRIGKHHHLASGDKQLQLAQTIFGRLRARCSGHGFFPGRERRGCVSLALDDEHGLFRIIRKGPRADQPLFGTPHALDLAPVRVWRPVCLSPARADLFAGGVAHGKVHFAGRLGVFGFGTQGLQGFRFPAADFGQLRDGIY